MTDERAAVIGRVDANNRTIREYYGIGGLRRTPSRKYAVAAVGNKKRNGVGAPISLTGRGRGDFGNEN
jgi:hypothetical protein